MTETVEAPGTDLATIKQSSHELDRIARLGLWMGAAQSDSKDPNAIGMTNAIKMAFADSLGLAIYAATEVHFINGQFTLSSKCFRALAHKHGIRVIPHDSSDKACTAIVIGPDGHELGRSTFTIEMAKKRGLLDRPGKNWQTIPERMLWARASKIALDDYAPWVTVGVMTADEAGDPDFEVFDPDDIPFGDDEQGTLA
jgi:hypothetical protein